METGSLSRLWHLVAAVAIALAILPLGIVPDAQAATGPYVFSCKTKGVGYTLKKQPKKFIIDCYRLDVRARKLTWVAPNRATGTPSRAASAASGAISSDPGTSETSR